MRPTEQIPNEPDLLVGVSFTVSHRLHFGRRAGQTIDVPVQYVGASAREVSGELSAEARRSAPIVWRFICGIVSGGDDPRSEPPWRELRVEVPSGMSDARSALERELSHETTSNFCWFVMRKPVLGERN